MASFEHATRDDTCKLWHSNNNNNNNDDSVYSFYTTDTNLTHSPKLPRLSSLDTRENHGKRKEID